MTTLDFTAFLYEETSIRVAEEIGPNSVEYAYRFEALFNDEHWVSQVRAAWLWKQGKPAENDAHFEKEVAL
jgi:hypothetical protein